MSCTTDSICKQLMSKSRAASATVSTPCLYGVSDSKTSNVSRDCFCLECFDRNLKLEERATVVSLFWTRGLFTVLKEEDRLTEGVDNLDSIDSLVSVSDDDDNRVSGSESSVPFIVMEFFTLKSTDSDFRTLAL